MTEEEGVEEILWVLEGDSAGQENWQSIFLHRGVSQTTHASHSRWTVLEALAIMELARIVEPTN